MKLNCQDCMRGDHGVCKNIENCLCAEDNHGIKKPSLADGVRVSETAVPPKPEDMEYEQAQKDRERLDNLLDNEVTDASEDNKAIEITKLLITSGHIVSKIEIKRILQEWCRKYGIKIDIPEIIAIVFDDAKTFTALKDVCFNIGLRKKEVLFEKDQFIEVSYYLMGRYHIKRIELNGNMIFFNDKYYSIDAEALIRRKSRDIMLKSKNGDINEIIKTIQDTCQIVTWQDIADSVHIKCLLNGTYDIQRGVFRDYFDPDDLVLNIIPHEYNEEMGWEVIENNVASIIEDKNDRESYYDSLSSALHPFTGIDYQFGGVGQPGTGKSQICFLSKMTLGPDNVTEASIHAIASDKTTQKDVAFKFLNIDMDMSDNTIQGIDTLKKWITQDDFTARGIYERNTTFRPTTRICFMANDLYEINSEEDAEAIYERTHVIKMDKKFRGTDGQVRDIMKKTVSEEHLSGFISYLLKNAHEIWKRQEWRHPMNKMTVEQTWNQYGNRIKEFTETCLEMGENKEDTVDVWNAWMSFTRRKNYHAKNKKKFHEIFDEIVGESPSKTRIGSGEDSKQVYAYHGFRLLRDEEVAKNETTPLTSEMNQAQKALQALTNFPMSNLTTKSENYSILVVKLTELLELLDYMRGDRK